MRSKSEMGREEKSDPIHRAPEVRFLKRLIIRIGAGIPWIERMSSRAPRPASEPAPRAIFASEEGEVIACDLPQRRCHRRPDHYISKDSAELVDGVKRESGGRMDGIVANAGGGPPKRTLQLNFFGAVATLEGLRPLLATSAAPARRGGLLDSVV